MKNYFKVATRFGRETLGQQFFFFDGASPEETASALAAAKELRAFDARNVLSLYAQPTNFKARLMVRGIHVIGENPIVPRAGSVEAAVKDDKSGES